MDPDVALQRIREGVQKLQKIVENKGSNMSPEDVVLMDETMTHVQALDEWLSNGGFPPSDWKK